MLAALWLIFFTIAVLVGVLSLYFYQITLPGRRLLPPGQGWALRLHPEG
ncbi:MAG: hypothetical protein ACYC9Q_12060 [Bacillota bacterium]